MKSHVLFKDTDIYLINFPPQLTQWACIQKVRMNNADFKTALLQRMSSSHTVNTNKLPKVLKSRTPVPLRAPIEGGLGDAGSPCVMPCQQRASRGAARQTAESQRSGTDRTAPGKNTTLRAFIPSRTRQIPNRCFIAICYCCGRTPPGRAGAEAAPVPFLTTCNLI